MTNERKCPDCGAKPGETHASGCDVERCSVCEGQWISCGHDGHDPEKSKWSGEWPGVTECRERGWYAVHRPDLGSATPGKNTGCWWPCTQDFPDAVEDLNRLAYFQQTGVDQFKDAPVLRRDLSPPSRGAARDVDSKYHALHAALVTRARERMRLEEEYESDLVEDGWFRDPEGALETNPTPGELPIRRCWRSPHDGLYYGIRDALRIAMGKDPRHPGVPKEAA